MTLDEFNRLAPRAVVAELVTCCASQGWAQRVCDGRPYPTVAALVAAGDAAFRVLSPAETDAAVAAHPRIGERPAGASRTSAWSRQEQAGVRHGEGAHTALAELNAEYEERFGRVFLICATGRTAEEIVREARRRLANDPATEHAEMVRELGAIVQLRLRKLVSA